MIGIDKVNIERLKGAMLGLALAFSIYISFSMSTISNGRVIFQIGHLLMAFLVCVLFGLLGKKMKVLGESNQYFHLVIAAFFIAGFLWISTIIRYAMHLILGYELNRIDVHGYQCLSQTIFLVFLAREVLLNKLHLKYKELITAIIRHKQLVMLIAVVVILSYSSWSIPYKYDGVLYYSVSKDASLYSISSMSFYGHMAQGSGLIVTYFMNLVGRNPVRVWYLANAFTEAIGGVFFYLLLKSFVKGKKEVLYVLLTAVYLLSPFVLGMSGYASVDFFCANLFLPVLYYTIEEKWFLQIPVGMIYACTKEPGFLIYGALCAVVLLIDIYENRKEVLLHYRYLGMMLVAFFWFITLMVIGIWNAGGSSAGIDFWYIANKAKSLFVLNFSWIFLIIIVLGGIARFLYDRRILYIWGPLVVFLMFSFYLNAGNHARYTDIVPICLYLLASIVILKIGDVTPVLSYIIGLVLSVIMVLSSYFTFDPLSERLLNKIVSSDGIILSTDINYALPGDATLYNRQGLYLEKAYSQMIEYGLNNDYVIVTHAYSGSTYYFDGIMEVGSVEAGDYYIQEEYWDSSSRKRSNEIDKEGLVFDIYSLQDVKAMKRLASENKGHKIMYSYLEGVDGDICSEIESCFDILERKSFVSNGWKINTVVFE